ncbi:hypothetical protein FB451DRAFT_1376883 [Mycena latifolia]|nr:hypothetical protein FB451DRAFT_1376883 [Mycena latifolia]
MTKAPRGSGRLPLSAIPPTITAPPTGKKPELRPFEQCRVQRKMKFCWASNWVSNSINESPRAKFQMGSPTVLSYATSTNMSSSKKGAVPSGEDSERISALATARMVADDPLRPGEKNEPTKSRNGQELVERELREESQAASAIRK